MTAPPSCVTARPASRDPGPHNSCVARAPGPPEQRLNCSSPFLDRTAGSGQDGPLHAQPLSMGNEKRAADGPELTIRCRGRQPRKRRPEQHRKHAAGGTPGPRTSHPNTSARRGSTAGRCRHLLPPESGDRCSATPHCPPMAHAGGETTRNKRLSSDRETVYCRVECHAQLKVTPDGRGGSVEE